MRMPSPLAFLLAAIIAVLIAGAFATIAVADDSVAEQTERHITGP